MSRWLLIFAIVLTSGYYIYQVMPGCAGQRVNCYALHYEIMNHTAEAPYRYRILAPALAQLLVVGDSETALDTAYLIFHMICFLALYSGMYKWLRVWGRSESALLGVFLLAVVWPLAFLRYYLSPYTALEVALLTWSLLCLFSMRRSSFSQALIAKPESS